jgi:hypothetical protein
MKTLVKLSSALIVILTLTSCSSNSNSKTNSSSSDLYHGGETVDGYTLPPMPNPTQNDKTLLGIDTNTNGIRDDVEIYIYNRFQGYTNSKVEREIAKQWARTATRLIQNPESAYEDKKYELVNRVLDCETYYHDKFLVNLDFNGWLKYSIEHKVFNSEFEDTLFNTKERIRAYIKFNGSLGGHVYPSRPIDKVKESCDFDPDPLIEGTL